MIEIALLIGISSAAVVGFAAWKLRSDRGVSQPSQAPGRCREDARDWQRRFGAESLLSDNFFPPTQNEILETLCLLDHLTPHWETGDPVSAQRAFLDELALNFPTLRRTSSSIPVASIDSPEARELSARREAFRVRRAQFNALNQITSDLPATDETAPGEDLPDPQSDVAAGTSRNVWPFLLGGAAVLIAAILGGLRVFPEAVDHKMAAPPDIAAASVASPVAPAAIPTASAVLENDSSTPEPPSAAVAEADAESTPAPTAAPPAQIVEAKPVPVPLATPSPTVAALVQQIALSKQRAVGKYPTLAVEGSEINLRFVFRYKNLVKENSPRLRDPNWPELLVEECAVAAGASAKHDGFTRVLGTPR